MDLARRSHAARAAVRERPRLLVTATRTTACRCRRAACRRTDAVRDSTFASDIGLSAGTVGGGNPAGSAHGYVACAGSRLRRQRDAATAATAIARSARVIGYFLSRTTSRRCSIRIDRAGARVLGGDDPERALIGEQRFAVDGVGDDDVVSS